MSLFLSEADVDKIVQPLEKKIQILELFQDRQIRIINKGFRDQLDKLRGTSKIKRLPNPQGIKF